MSEKIKRNERPRRGVKLGVLDIVIIVALLLSIACIAARGLITPTITLGDGDICNISFKAEYVRYTTFDMLESGRDVYTPSGELLGVLGDMSYVPSAFSAEDKNGDMIEVHYPEDTLIDITGTINATLYQSDGRFMLKDGQRLTLGEELVISTGLCDLKLVITEINVVE